MSLVFAGKISCLIDWLELKASLHFKKKHWLRRQIHVREVDGKRSIKWQAEQAQHLISAKTKTWCFFSSSCSDSFEIMIYNPHQIKKAESISSFHELQIVLDVLKQLLLFIAPLRLRTRLQLLHEFLYLLRCCLFEDSGGLPQLHQCL